MENLNRYNQLIKGDYELNNKSNFECSLLIKNLYEIKNNELYKQEDLPFNIDERINELNTLGRSKFLNSKYKSFISLDLETTGLSRENDRIIQIAMIKVINGNIVDKYDSYVNPKKHISESASEVNHIYDYDVCNERTIKEIFPEILSFIDGLPIIAHNASFDIGFLECEYFRSFKETIPELNSICTMKLWKKRFNQIYNEAPFSAKLCTLVDALLYEEDIKEYRSNSHDAYCDALATAKVFMKMQ